MTRCLACMLMLLSALPAAAQPADRAEQVVIDANRAIQAHNDQIAADNAAAQAAYREEVARVEAKRRADEAGFAAATAAFEAKQAQYEADMASWRAESARVAAQARAPAPVRAAPVRVAESERTDDSAIVCRTPARTGSMIASPRVCKTKRAWRIEGEGQ